MKPQALDINVHGICRALGLPSDTPHAELLRAVCVILRALAARDAPLARAARDVLARHRARGRTTIQ